MMAANSHDLIFSPIIIGTMRWGTWGAQLNSKEVEHFIDTCLDMELRDFDHADIYGDYTEEDHFGEVIKRRSDLKSKIQITTKCGIKRYCKNRPDHNINSYNSTKAHIIHSAENSLNQLGVAHIDVLLIHRPDYLMDPSEVAEAFEILKNSGKVRSFGVSNFTPSQVDLLSQHFPLITNQIEFSILHRTPLDDGTLDQCMSKNIVPSVWSPFGGGKIFTNTEEVQIKRIQKMAKKLGKKYNASLDQILLAWILKHPSGMIPVVGSSKVDRVISALGATQVQLTHEEWYELWQAATGHEVP